MIKRVSILQTITDFAEKTDDPIAKDHLLLMKLAKRVEREINTFRSRTLKAFTQTVDGTTLDLPLDTFKVEKVYPGDLTDDIANYYLDLQPLNAANVQYSQLDIQRNSSYIIQEDFLWANLDRYLWLDTKLWDIVNEQLVFPSGYVNHDMTIFYRAWEVDGNGYILINESHVDAISAYFKYYIAERTNWKRFRSQRMIRGGEVSFERDLKQDYLFARSRAKSDDLERTPMDRREIDGIY